MSLKSDENLTSPRNLQMHGKKSNKEFNFIEETPTNNQIPY